ncbi:MAG: tRNA (cytosine(32)/uridine(32)-2'-O)-methyltransferase TrmJ [Gammaproteobacteria bacterium]|nr:MAG: tRNA (cytosine(32)/uridine(32)-2'-O)-methyltransferase TrmJ [Gammaproteobacteria bacterium]
MSLSNIRIVLIETSHPGNIGACARAMKTMGLSALYLVSPKIFPSGEAIARAAGAEDVLESATVCDSLEQALAGCTLVMGASARARTIEWPLLTPRACAAQLVREAVSAPVALVLGREHSGLSNEELDRCHYLARIRANPGFSSLNLAAALQVFAYEIFLAQGEAAEETGDHAPATCRDALVSREAGSRERLGAEQMELFYAHLERVLVRVGFLNPQYPKKLMRRLRRLFNRARPDQNEMNILRGMLTEVERKLPAIESPAQQE